MDKISNHEFFSAILASGILAPYLERDSDLAEMVRSPDHPESRIYNVTFNGRSRHFGVRCGQVKNQLHVICVMTGGHIPDELLGESTR
jgi:hypothetical protein